MASTVQQKPCRALTACILHAGKSTFSQALVGSAPHVLGSSTLLSSGDRFSLSALQQDLALTLTMHPSDGPQMDGLSYHGECRVLRTLLTSYCSLTERG